MRTERRAAGSRRRRQGCGGQRSPGGPGAYLGLRVKAQVSWLCLQGVLPGPESHLNGSLVISWRAYSHPLNIGWP